MKPHIASPLLFLSLVLGGCVHDLPSHTENFVPTAGAGSGPVSAGGPDAPLGSDGTSLGTSARSLGGDTGGLGTRLGAEASTSRAPIHGNTEAVGQTGQILPKSPFPPPSSKGPPPSTR